MMIDLDFKSKVDLTALEFRSEVAVVVQENSTVQRG